MRPRFASRRRALHRPCRVSSPVHRAAPSGGRRRSDTPPLALDPKHEDAHADAPNLTFLPALALRLVPAKPLIILLKFLQGTGPRKGVIVRQILQVKAFGGGYPQKLAPLFAGVRAPEIGACARQHGFNPVQRIAENVRVILALLREKVRTDRLDGPVGCAPDDAAPFESLKNMGCSRLRRGAPHERGEAPAWASQGQHAGLARFIDKRRVCRPAGEDAGILQHLRWWNRQRFEVLVTLDAPREFGR